jgi:hypothetical protein
MDFSIDGPVTICATSPGGKRNLSSVQKRWWFDLEMIDGVAVKPAGGTNERDLNLGREQKLASIQKLALYPPQLQPKGGVTVSETVPVDRPAGLKLYATAESPDAARARES